MPLFKSETLYDRRRRELEEEAERVRKNMRAIMKSVGKGSASGAATPEAGTSAEPPVVEIHDSIVEIEGEAPVEVPIEPVSEEPVRRGGTADLPPYGTARLRYMQNKQKENLPNFLATGSFGKRGPVTREKKIQRNKAVFMAVLAVIAVFSLVSWLS